MDLKLPWRAGLSRCISGYAYNEGTHTGRSQYGIDFFLSYDDVIAVDAGIVVEAVSGQPNTYPAGPVSLGNYVTVDHQNGVYSRYGHLDSVNVREGDVVGHGSVLGVSGNSGYSTGPHLHFALSFDGTGVIPEPMSGYTGFVHFGCQEGIYYVSDNVAPPPPPTPAPGGEESILATLLVAVVLLAGGIWTLRRGKA